MSTNAEHSHESLVRPINKSKYDRTREVFNLWWGRRGGALVHSLEEVDLSASGEIAAANHDSWWDPWAVAEAYHQAADAYPRSMAKDELWKPKPVLGNAFGDYISDLGGFPVKRKNNFFQQPVAVANVEHIANAGEVLAMYPQGTRRNHERGQVPLESLENGIGFIAVKFGLPIRPVGIRGTAERQFANVVLGEKIEVERVDFDASNRREFVSVGREIVEPLIIQLQEAMHETVQEAESRREEIIRYMPPMFLRQAFIS